MKTTKEVDRFTVEDNDGNNYEIIVSQDFIRAKDSVSEEWIPKWKSMKTLDGFHVNVINESDGIYEILILNEKIRVNKI